MYHFVGIKGAGMSALASIMKNLGYEVQGSDVDKKFFTDEGLTKNNINTLVYNKDNIKEDLIIVQGASIKDDHEEIIKAKELNLKIIKYHDMIGKLSKQYKTISIAGCHGKTTTTAMLSHVLNNIIGINYFIGDGTGYADKDNEFFALESCEYQRHFLSYFPYYTIITNIDLDHLDYFKDLDDIISAYQEFIDKTSNKVILCGDDINTRKLIVKDNCLYYGIKDNNNVIAKDIEYKNNGISFSVYINNNLYGKFDLPLYGEHQLLDALAVITICYLENIDSKEVDKVFKTFKGAKRRFTETIVGNNIIIDDYAHHPNEVKSTINSIKQKYPNKKIVAIFQPHTFSRTKNIYKELCNILNEVDYSYILDIHPARENQEDYPDITSDIIINNIKNGYRIDDKDSGDLCKYNNTVFAFMSPNDLSILENDLIEKLKEAN